MRDPRQKIFVREYVQDFNATRAYIAAGYSEQGARAGASRLLANVNVQQEVAKLLESLCKELAITKDRVLRETALLAFSNMEDFIRVQDGDAYVDFSNLDRDKAAAIQEVTVEEYSEGRGKEKRDIKRTKFRLASKREALELLGKHLSLFRDRVEHVGEGGGPIAHTIRFGDGSAPPNER
jgi:phage terminase small subunit